MPQRIAHDQEETWENRSPRLARPLYETLVAWLTGLLAPQGYARPQCKRLAVLVSGLIASDKATLSQVSASVAALQISAAK